MKPKRFIVLVLFALVLSGCKFNDYTTEEEILVSKILKSQQRIYEASANKNSLITDEIYQASHYYHDSHTQEDILSLKLNVAELSLVGEGYNHFSLSDVELDFDLDTRTQDYIYDYAGYIYDDYYHDRYRFYSTRSFVGNGHQTPYKGIMKLEGNTQNITVFVLDEQRVDIKVYDHYDSYHDRTIHTTWTKLGI